MDYTLKDGVITLTPTDLTELTFLQAFQEGKGKVKVEKEWTDGKTISYKISRKGK